MECSKDFWYAHTRRHHRISKRKFRIECKQLKVAKLSKNVLEKRQKSLRWSQLWKQKRVPYFLQCAAHIHKAKLHLIKENLMKYLSEPSTSPPPQWRHTTRQVLSEQSMYCTAECYISTAFLLTCLQKAVRTLQFSPMHINASNQASTALQFWQLSEQLCSIALPGFPFFLLPLHPLFTYLCIFHCRTAVRSLLACAAPRATWLHSPENSTPGLSRAHKHRCYTAELQKEEQGREVTAQKSSSTVPPKLWSPHSAT